MTRREVFGMFAGLIGIPSAAVASYPDFGDPSFDMAAYLQAEWYKKLSIAQADVDKAFVKNLLNPIRKDHEVQFRLGILDMSTGRECENDNRD